MNIQLNLDQMNLASLSEQDAMIVDGGTYSSGQAVGVYVRRIVDGVMTLNTLYEIGLALL